MEDNLLDSKDFSILSDCGSLTCKVKLLDEYTPTRRKLVMRVILELQDAPQLTFAPNLFWENRFSNRIPSSDSSPREVESFYEGLTEGNFLKELVLPLLKNWYQEYSPFLGDATPELQAKLEAVGKFLNDYQ
ncbi:MAG: hypothetical protein ACRC80_01165 [Waterburya sp.]